MSKRFQHFLRFGVFFSLQFGMNYVELQRYGFENFRVPTKGLDFMHFL